MSVIYVSGRIHPDVLAAMRVEADVLIDHGPHAVEYALAAHSVDAVLTRGIAFDRRLIAESPRLRIIARHGVGHDGVDIDAATEHGIWVTTTPGSNSTAVAEHVFALLLGLARRIVPADTAARTGRWSSARPDLVGFELRGRRLGVVGFGAIGRKVARIAAGFDMDVVVHDPFVPDSTIRDARATPLPMREVIASADVLTIHVPLGTDSRHLVGAAEIATMKPGAVLINTARGGLVDEAAALDALRDGRIAAMALDVAASEGASAEDPFGEHSPAEHALAGFGRDRLLVTPHIGGQTVESFLETGMRAWGSIRSALAGARPDGALNDVR